MLWLESSQLVKFNSSWNLLPKGMRWRQHPSAVQAIIINFLPDGGTNETDSISIVWLWLQKAILIIAPLYLQQKMCIP